MVLTLCLCGRRPSTRLLLRLHILCQRNYVKIHRSTRLPMNPEAGLHFTPRHYLDWLSKVDSAVVWYFV